MKKWGPYLTVGLLIPVIILAFMWLARDPYTGFIADPDGDKDPMESGNILATNSDLLPQYKDALKKAREA